MLCTEARTWLKEYLEPVSVFVGLPLILPCNPPVGPPKPQTYWMNSCKHLQTSWWNNTDKTGILNVHSAFLSCFVSAAMVPIRQDRRVSMAENGDLYFSSVVADDAITNYVCTARFPNSNIIHQKPPLILQVHTGVRNTIPWVYFRFHSYFPC